VLAAAGSSPCCLHSHPAQPSSQPRASSAWPGRQPPTLQAFGALGSLSGVFGSALQLRTQRRRGQAEAARPSITMSAVAQASTSISGRMAELKKQGKCVAKRCGVCTCCSCQPQRQLHRRLHVVQGIQQGSAHAHPAHSKGR
jgi:hypothetical protein